MTEHRGAISVVAAALLPVMIGVVGLAVDIGSWYVQKGNLQVATDAAALGGLVAMNRGASDANIADAANHDAGLNGYTPSGKTTLTLSIDHTAQTVAASMSTPGLSLFSAPFLKTGTTIRTAATAALSPAPVCLLALNTSGTAISLNGAASVVAPKCAVYSNSTSSSGISAGGASSIQSLSTCSAGSYSGGSGHFSPVPQSNCASKADPYSTLPAPVAGSCIGAISYNGGTKTLNPGTYCSGISIKGNATVTFNPGLYIIKGGSLSILGNAKVSGSGVTFYFTGGGYLNITGGSTIRFSAPTTGDYAGVVMFQDRASTGLTNNMTGNVALTIDGALYFPTNRLNATGNSGSSLTTVVVGSFAITGSGGLGVDPTKNANFKRQSLALVK